MDLASFAESLVGYVWSPWLFFLLLFCGLVFSIISKFVQWRIMTHGYACVRGHYDNPDDVGHINHFQALCAALSATIGLGNIAGVAVAVSLGGPGAVFWMWVVGIFGMTVKFMECTLAVMFRDERDVPDPSAPALVEDDIESRALEYDDQERPALTPKPHGRGEVRGGPMWYIHHGLVEPLKKRGNPLWMLFALLAILFSIATMLNSVGGGNMFQGWNIADMLHAHFNVPQLLSALVVSALVAMVIIGGIRRIGSVASKLVPIMCVIYVGGALYVILLHASEIPAYLALIVKSAFNSSEAAGAFGGASVWIAFEWGLRRACFSNEAGEGSAAMAHAAARTDEPVREGVVAGIGPFVDTIVICTMSALVILMSGTWTRPAIGNIAAIDGDIVTVACDTTLPAKMRQLYQSRVTEEGATAAVHTVRAVKKDLATVSLPIECVEAGERDGAWDPQTITLTFKDAGIDPATRQTVVVGQPVHLDIDGANMTSFAFDTAILGFGRYMITLAVCLFGFSTMLSWSYYGEKAAEYLLGSGAILPFKFIFVIFVFLGMVLEKFQTVYDFSDATTGMMVLCNLPAVLLLSPVVVRAANSYFRRLDAGEMPRRNH